MDALTLPDRHGRALYLTEEGRAAELDIDGLDYPFVLDADGMRKLRAWLDGKLIGADAPTATLQDGELPERAVDQLRDPAEKAMLPFASESELSRMAALQAYPRQGTQRQKIIGKLAEHPEGWTRDQLAAILGMSPNTVRPRVVELIAGGWVREADAGWSEAGNPAARLVLTERAVEAVRRGG